MKNQILNSILVRKPKHSNFDLSHTNLTTMKTGILYPTLCMDLVPGDKVNLSANMFARAQAMIAPAFVNVKMYTHFFFVPMELVYSHWSDFLSGGSNGATFPEKHYLDSSNAGITADIGNGSLADHLGYPTNGSGKLVKKLDLTPFKAYQLIFNEYYRDQNLQNEIEIRKDSVGSQALSSTTDKAFANALLTLRRRNYAHDYFTSSLPFPQKGPSISVPVSGSIGAGTSGMSFIKSSSGIPSDGTAKFSGGMLTDTNGNVVKYDQGLQMSNGGMEINALRKASKLQAFAEKLARGGSRYFELLYSMFGVRPNDETLQRPQYLGGGVQQVMISEVLQNGLPQGTLESNTPLGTQAGKGISAGSTRNINFFAKEYGYLMAITSIMPETLYYQGLPKQLNKWDRFDYYFPEFDNLGEQEVSHKELYYDNTTESTPFGYLPRYAEYKTAVNRCHGQFKSTLAYWHAGRDVTSNHQLNESFISTQDNALDKIFAVNQVIADPFVVNIGFNIFARRPMSKYSTPIL